MDRDLLVITGAGGIGQAIARRQGPGRHVLLADINQDALASAAASLEGLGLRVSTQPVDVSARESVQALAEAAQELGNVTPGRAHRRRLARSGAAVRGPRRGPA